MTELQDHPFGASTALLGHLNGRYPDANAVLVQGTDSTFLLDAPLGVVERKDTLPELDAVILTHCHEDHIPALSVLPNVPCLVHEADRPGLDSLEAFMNIFGQLEPQRTAWEKTVVDTFLFEPRPDAEPFEHGKRWDLGGGVSVEAIHAPGHTRGHCIFLVQPDDLLFLVDIDLSGFGPYYGDAWSDLEEFEATLEMVRDLKAQHYLTGHHLGVIDEETFRTRLVRYRDRIGQREQRLLDFLEQPRTMEDIVAHRIIYRPQDSGAGIDSIEHRSSQLHLDRLIRQGAVESEGGRYAAG